MFWNVIFPLFWTIVYIVLEFSVLYCILQAVLDSILESTLFKNVKCTIVSTHVYTASDSLHFAVWTVAYISTQRPVA